MCDVLSHRFDHLFRPFLGKNEKKKRIRTCTEKKIRILLMSSAYRRDTSYNSGFALLTEEENHEV